MIDKMPTFNTQLEQREKCKPKYVVDPVVG